MKQFESIYKSLNTAQKQAVDSTDGPLLVLAGPGTGKTQLLSARIANILSQSGGVMPSNILCLTFTESGALNMRERLAGMIGPDAYNIGINTYHSFGSDIIKAYPEYFQTINVDRTDDVRMERPIDELTQIQIVAQIVESLPYGNPLLSARYFVKSVVNTISELKGALINPDKLRALALDNLSQIDSLQADINRIVNETGGISRKKADYFDQYKDLLAAIGSMEGSLAAQGAAELVDAYDQAVSDSSSKPLTVWKNNWLIKDSQDNFTFTKRADSEKMLAVADVYESYELALKAKGYYDFDDMILRSIEALKNQDELRFNLQERYQYILLDEFQDTNPAQFELVKAIADHPVHEGRPNIMAVGDDDQAIYAFQGADVGNMKKFIDSFTDVSVVNLVENYRSHSDILHAAHSVSEQIEDRLHHKIEGVEKNLKSAAQSLPKDARIKRQEFNSAASEYGGIASEVARLVSEGTEPSDIAVLAPRHRLLEGMVPFLNKHDIAVSYDKRENILQTSIVQSLKLMSELVLALRENQTATANELFPVVLSLSFWQIPTEKIWKLNWWYRDERDKSWAELALQDEPLKDPVLFYLALSAQDPKTPLENVLDALTGVIEVPLGEDKSMTCPLKEYYFSKSNKEHSSLKYFEAISHLSVIRAKLREYQKDADEVLTLEGFLEFFAMYEAAGQSLINSHPIAQSSSSVQLMTAYKAKGLEFDHVFILSAHDDVWGSRAKGASNKIALPQNLKHIRYSGSSEDELRRLLFVAITRAKSGLYISSHTHKDSGKPTQSVKYLLEFDGSSQALPDAYNQIEQVELTTEALSAHIETLWQSRHTILDADLKSLLTDKLAKYQMSPTHLNSFIDLEYGGPEAFLLNTLLQFPKAPTVDGEFGTAIHNTFEWYQNQTNLGSASTKDALEFYEQELGRRYISAADYDLVLAKGQDTIKSYLAARKDMFASGAKSEVNFRAEGVLIGEAHLNGKIDRLEIDEKAKTIQIADYKTGSSFKSWRPGSVLKHLKYEQQLYLYKVLVEGSNTYAKYTVQSARLEFVQPESATGKIPKPLYIEFDEAKEAAVRKLVEVVWAKIQELDLPDVSGFSSDAGGSNRFIRGLLGGL